MTIIEMERRVSAFIDAAKVAQMNGQPRVWDGIIASLKRYSDEGVHGGCAFEAHTAGLLETIRIESEDVHIVSPKLQTLTRFTPAASREIMQQLRTKISAEM